MDRLLSTILSNPPPFGGGQFCAMLVTANAIAGSVVKTRFALKGANSYR